MTEKGTLKTAPDSLLARGRTAEVYAWQDNQVLKLFYAWCPPEWARCEADNLRVAAAAGLRIPRFIETAEIEGRRGIICERVDGKTMLAELAQRPWRVDRLARTLAELHVQMHAKSGAGLASLRSSVEAAIRAADGLPPDMRDQAIDLMSRLPDGSALCHLDFHPDQVVMATDGPQIIDWMSACEGNPLADVARTCLLSEVGHVPYGGVAMRALASIFRRRFRRTYTRRYVELSRTASLREVELWMIPLAAARLREGIPGEEGPLLRFVARGLRAQRRARRSAYGERVA